MDPVYFLLPVTVDGVVVCSVVKRYSGGRKKKGVKAAGGESWHV